MSDEIGGNWYYKNPNGMSACYESLHIDTSKWRLAFEDFPAPADWPDFPHHAQLFQYFKDYFDFNTYCRDLAKEIGRGERRANAAGNRLPVEARAAATMPMAAE